MAAELVGGALLSATLQVVFDRLDSRDVVDYLRGKKLTDDLINNLKIVLSAVNAVLDDAEEKQITNLNVKQRLDELEDASYHADDLLDEIATHALRSKLKAGSRKSKTSKLFKCSFPISARSYNRDMKKKLEEILRRFEVFEKSINFLGLTNKSVGEKPSPRQQTTSLIEESEVFGRGGDKEAIIKLLLTDNCGDNNVSVIPIVGMGGVGKTTLAQSVYNHDQVKKHFNYKAWVCVSEEFDFMKVTKTILYAVKKSHFYDNKDLDSLQIELKEELMGKKYLIVLDDVWNENYDKWENMSRPFKHGAQGSKILVTTRNESVAKIMRTVPTHYLKHLKDEDCWQLFAKHAFYNEDFAAYPALEIIGKKIVKKCKGLPLAAKTLGGLLRSTVHVGEWKRISESEIWDLSDNESNILPALWLSYHYLPSHLKRCFAFCSIFPEDYKFHKHELVLLWMAENFLQQSKRNKRMEDVGDEYFNELVSRSFFQRSNGEEESFVMHDLIRDLAKYVSRNYCLTLADGNSEEAHMVKVRHLAIGTSIPIARFDSIFEAACLRTFLPTSWYSFVYFSNEAVNHVILKLRCLRVLSMSGCRKLRQLHESIGEQRHLRHLDLSDTSIKRLPESVCLLYNLQTLNLSRCWNLIELPKDIHHLINLRHLDIRGCYKLEMMPRHISKLKSLQTLTDFIVGKDNAAKIDELRELQDLHGRLSLFNLNNVARAKDALEAKLMEKKYLEELHLEWKDDTNDSKHDREVLENLSPHTNLKRLSIDGYGGKTFPNWLGDHSFCNIVFISLDGCKYCNSLPPLGQLPSLKTLHIEELSEVVTVGAEFYGSSERKPFALLEVLSFSKMSNWEKWCSIEVEDGEVFPKLQTLKITECDRLMTVDWPPNLPCLSRLEFYRSEVLVPSLPRTPAIRKLKLGKCEKLLQLQEVQQTVERISIGGCHGVELLTDILRKSQTWCHLQDLRIHNCSSPIIFPTACLPTTLTELRIEDCEKLEFPIDHSLKTSSIQKVSISNSCGGSGSLKFFPLDFFPNLKNLDITRCESLESLTVSDGQLCQNLTTLTIGGPNFISFPKGGLHAPNLISLSVEDCKKLKMLPEQMHNLLPSLQQLEIWFCPEVESFPEGGLPSNLNALSVRKCSKLIAERMKWNLQTLQALTGFGIEDEEREGEGAVVESFPEEGLLPSTLRYIDILGIGSLKRLDIKGLQQLTSLTSLYIQRCPQLHKLPEEGLPASLTYLDIGRCPVLKERCQMEKGQDWNKISHIPRIVIDDKYIC